MKKTANSKWKVFDQKKGEYVSVKCLKIITFDKFPNVVFFIHRALKEDECLTQFKCSESQSGVAVCSGSSVKNVIAFAEERLKDKTIEELKDAINDAIERQKSGRIL